MLNVDKEPYGKLPDGRQVDLYTLTNANGLKVRLMNYGAITVSVEVPDGEGKLTDVPHFGSTVGRYANRIAKGQFTLDGQTYTLAKNNGENHLHGGIKGFDKVLWEAEPVQTRDAVGVKFTYLSKDGEEGYPGNLNVTALYSLTNDNEFKAEFSATTDKPTVVNLAHHSYWNLAGAAAGDILGHELMLNADSYTPVDAGLIPTGELKSVTSTPMDFTKPTPIGARIVEVEGGYDHNFVLRSQTGRVALAARVFEPTTGRVMEIHTDQPGIQFYSGNFLDGTITGKGGVVYQKHHGLCLETQHYPDSPNKPRWSTSSRRGKRRNMRMAAFVGLCPRREVINVAGRRHASLATALVALALAYPAARAQTVGQIEPVDPPELSFYSKRLVVHGIPVMAHVDVSDAALEEAARRIDRQLSRAPEIVANLCRFGVQMHVIGKDQQVSDLPELRHLQGKPFDGEKTVDERGRGYGGLYTSCAEENLLLLPSDRYKEHRDICMHEFAHAILSFGLSRDIRDKIEAQRRKSVAAGKWPGAYAATNAEEFFAELTMWYFGSRGDYGKITPMPTKGATWLRSYDPPVYELIDSIYSGRLKPSPIEIVDLAALSPEMEGQIRSKTDQPATQVVFINRTDAPVTRFWLDFEGQRRSYGVVPPGGVTSQSTYATHAWLLEDADGKCLGIFVPDARIGRVVIGGDVRK